MDRTSLIAKLYIGYNIFYTVKKHNSCRVFRQNSYLYTLFLLYNLFRLQYDITII